MKYKSQRKLFKQAKIISQQEYIVLSRHSLSLNVRSDFFNMFQRYRGPLNLLNRNDAEKDLSLCSSSFLLPYLKVDQSTPHHISAMNHLNVSFTDSFHPSPYEILYNPLYSNFIINKISNAYCDEFQQLHSFQQSYEEETSRNLRFLLMPRYELSLFKLLKRTAKENQKFCILIQCSPLTG